MMRIPARVRVLVITMTRQPVRALILQPNLAKPLR